jgi:hypothetical protein
MAVPSRAFVVEFTSAPASLIVGTYGLSRIRKPSTDRIVRCVSAVLAGCVVAAIPPLLYDKATTTPHSVLSSSLATRVSLASRACRRASSASISRDRAYCLSLLAAVSYAILLICVSVTMAVNQRLDRPLRDYLLPSFGDWLTRGEIPVQGVAQVPFWFGVRPMLTMPALVIVTALAIVSTRRRLGGGS